MVWYGVIWYGAVLRVVVWCVCGMVFVWRLPDGAVGCCPYRALLRGPLVVPGAQRRYKNVSCNGIKMVWQWCDVICYKMVWYGII